MKITTRHSNLFILLILLSLKISAQKNPEQEIFCNPLKLNYRYQLDLPSRREAADPSLAFFKDKYYLFASKSGGCWVSDNLIKWSFITTADLPVEDYTCS
jgi:xylan 1,4-beta-xylosidase